jgi:hypothetical protein
VKMPNPSSPSASTHYACRLLGDCKQFNDSKRNEEVTH